jgi:hypothetical protein
MNLTEVLMAAVILVGSSGASLQIWARAAASEQRWSAQATLLQGSEEDRLNLQGQWRRQLMQGLDCQQATAAMLTLAAQQPAPGGMERQLQQAADGLSLQLIWPAAQRQRWVSPAALGLCAGPPAGLEAQQGAEP